jgi:hypothetical protein
MISGIKACMNDLESQIGKEVLHCVLYQDSTLGPCLEFPPSHDGLALKTILHHLEAAELV